MFFSLGGKQKLKNYCLKDVVVFRDPEKLWPKIWWETETWGAIHRKAWVPMECEKIFADLQMWELFLEQPPKKKTLKNDWVGIRFLFKKIWDLCGVFSNLIQMHGDSIRDLFGMVIQGDLFKGWIVTSNQGIKPSHGLNHLVFISLRPQVPKM